MRDPASNDPQSTEPVDIQMADMGRELGCRESPAFERLRDYLRVQSELPSRVIAEIVEMLNARCFADTQSWRQSRGAALWTELHWLNEEMLIEAFAELWMPQVEIKRIGKTRECRSGTLDASSVQARACENDPGDQYASERARRSCIPRTTRERLGHTGHRIEHRVATLKVSA